jgi:hypothetical protein
MRTREDLALGLCATCYTLKRQDDEYFGGLREQVLERDGYCCRVCGASGRRKRSIVVHHRVPGKSLLHLMISLCPGCHAKVGRTKVVLSQMPPLLRELWREQHPLGHEQTALDFRANFPVAKSAPLFRETAHGKPYGGSSVPSAVIMDRPAHGYCQIQQTLREPSPICEQISY